MDRGAWGAIYSPWGHKELDMTEQLTLTLEEGGGREEYHHPHSHRHHHHR